MDDRFFSDALVDYSGFAKTLGDLRGSFSLLEFLDLCAILEGLVLHDRLIMVGGDTLQEKWESFLKPLLDEGIILRLPSKKKVNPGPRPDEARDQRDFNLQASRLKNTRRTIAKSTVLDSWHEVGRLLGAEEELGCSPLALIRQRPYYEDGSQARAKHTVCNLIGHYQNLSAALLELRNSARYSFDPYIVVPIPPLPLLILQLCRTYDDVIPRVLDIREDYSKLRASLRDLRASLADPSVTPQEKLKVMASWQRSWQTLQKYEHSMARLELANNALDLPNLNAAIEGIGLNIVRLEKLLKFMLERAVIAFHEWRVRLLHSVAKKYLSTPDTGLNNEVFRLFGTRVTADDLREVDMWSKAGDHSTRGRHNG
jgi:hypothetical protein